MPDDAQLPSTLSGTLHMFAALDWGDEIDLAHVARLVPAEWQTLARRSRTPSSIAYRPTPLRYPLQPITLPIAGCPGPPLVAEAELTIFDFAAVSLALRVAIERSPAEWTYLAGCLSEPEPIMCSAREVLQPLFDRLRPAIEDAAWSELSEEYFVFQFAPGAALPPPERLVAEHSAWLAGLLRLEDEPLAPDELTEALRMRLSYTPADLFVAEWSAAVLIDQSCDETLKTVEFANLQLLEFRHIDNRLDDRLAGAYGLIHPRHRGLWPFATGARRRLRELGELRLEAHDLYERTGNALKLVGDQYLARVYQMLAARFHLGEWQHSIERSLGVIEGAYQVVSDESDTARAETLEWIVILLITVEVGLALLH
ncbi:MAG TPA: hypothetical protein VHZ24_21555 [Pirellulales bacterium]|jgi:hypothetical protein|nr:hypothetical protein [Pirellulales bacterium]